MIKKNKKSKIEFDFNLARKVELNECPYMVIPPVFFYRFSIQNENFIGKENVPDG